MQRGCFFEVEVSEQGLGSGRKLEKIATMHTWLFVIICKDRVELDGWMLRLGKEKNN